MDIKDLDKRQLILLTLLITFVVSIATGIITVSIMEKAPQAVPQTINNVIQRTIEKVTTVQAPTLPDNSSTEEKETTPTLIGDGDAMVSIYNKNESPTDSTSSTTDPQKALGQGIIISDVGLILVDSTILTDKEVYKVILNKTDFDATILKKFGNGFTILKISQKKPADTTKPEVTNQGASVATPAVDSTQ